jgi:hypothetical protein
MRLLALRAQPITQVSFTDNREIARRRFRGKRVAKPKPRDLMRYARGVLREAD